MKQRFLFIFLAAGLMFSCARIAEAPVDAPEQFVLGISLPGGEMPKTTLGPSSENSRKVYWADGDQIRVNDKVSTALSGVPAETTQIQFSFASAPSAPYNVLYPASFYKDPTHITLPASQEFVNDNLAANAEPLAGYSSTETYLIGLNHLCTMIRLSIKKDAGVDASNLASVIFKGNNGEQITGDFTIDYSNHTIASASDAALDKLLIMTMDAELSEVTSTDVILVIPAGTYSSGFTVEMEDNQGRTMTKVRTPSTTLVAGKLYRMGAFTFVPSPEFTEFDMADIEDELLTPEGYNVKGRVVDTSSNPIAGVVVSDGLQSVRTNMDGTFYMTSTISKVKYVQISTPSGYLPSITGGIPRFYKAKADITPAGGIYDFGDFVITPMANPNTFTIFVTADPQPRASDENLDNVAYRSLRGCESLYQDLQETKALINNRQVIGICLGDLTHENMDLMDTYATALGTLGYPTYNVIGNHDADMTKKSDEATAWKYESLFGPRNYSFNMGGIHFVVLDNLIMKNNGSNRWSDYDQGLTDDIWTWLQSDMAFVPTTTTVMVCAHSPMFKQENGSERTNSAKHGGYTSTVDGPAYGYGDLFDKYDEVHAWAGHTHSTFNFIYDQSHRHKNVQVHTLARATGELWTNEYLANGTPRGFTIVEVKDGKIDSWRFHPTKYLKSNFHGTHDQPDYDYCDWTYSGSSPKVAKMKDTGKDLDESYQMHVYTPSAYGDNMIYVNIFLWDSLWKLPTISIGVEDAVNMIKVEDADSYDRANDEIMSFYYAHYSILRSAGYKNSPRGVPLTMFRSPATVPATGTATVSVEDRFGNTYTRTISW